MTALLLTALFTAAAALAVAILAQALIVHAPAFAAVRRELATCRETRETRTRVSLIEVRRAGAVIYRPDFTPGARPRRAAPALRAA